MNKQLGQLELWLDTATTYAQSRSFDGNVLMGMRLAPDQFPLSRQIQIACDTAKLGASRLTGREAPKNDDTEATLDELRGRIRATRAYLDGFEANAFEASATRVITQPRWEGKTMTGADFLLEHAVPNFFFHLSTAYAILRHAGVPLGKRDYLGALTMTAPA